MSKYNKMLEYICNDDECTSLVEKGDWAKLLFKLDDDFDYNFNDIVKYLVSKCDVDLSQSKYYNDIIYSKDEKLLSLCSLRNKSKIHLYWDIEKHEIVELWLPQEPWDALFRIWAPSKEELIKFYALNGIKISKEDVYRYSYKRLHENGGIFMQIKPSLVGGFNIYA